MIQPDICRIHIDPMLDWVWKSW